MAKNNSTLYKSLMSVWIIYSQADIKLFLFSSSSRDLYNYRFIETKILMKIWLITHSEELKKPSGTGRLVKEALQNECEIIIWSRVSPNKDILKLSPSNTLLIYLCNDEQDRFQANITESIDNIIILDGTWQQARKIYNQSPYLQKFRHYEIQNIKSAYKKRRNQKDIGLCTAEVAIQLLTEYQHPAAKELSEKFIEFNQ